MLDNLEALAALADHGTMGKAALAIHISQSAISKRIANLEYQAKKRLILPHGRRVELTPAAVRLLERARPLIAELKQTFSEEQAEASGTLSVDISGSVLISWAADALAKVRSHLPQLSLTINTHHASVAVERVRAGESMLALVQGTSLIAPELSSLPVFNQTMVIVPSGLKRFRIVKGKPLKVLAIEAHTEAWSFIDKGLRMASAQWGFSLKVEQTLQSFSAITQMARAGFGHGLVPLGVARAFNIPPSKLVMLPSPGIVIPVSLIGRRTTLALPLTQRFYSALLHQSDQKRN